MAHKKIYYPDGPLQEWGYFKAGVRDSVNSWYYQNGMMTVQYTYANNNLSGLSKSFYENGGLKTEGNFLNGKENGLWKEYADTTIAVTNEKPTPNVKPAVAKKEAPRR